MYTPTLGHANDVNGTRLWRSSAADDMAIGCACILLCLLLNPFLALFFLAALSVFVRVPTTAFFISVPVSFTLLFFFREYGVDWSAVASDDIPGYVWLYEQNYLVSFSGIFSRFFEIPGSNEPLWQIPWWLLLHAFDASDKVFIFLHYLVVFLAIFISFFVLSKRYFIAFSLVYFFITPLSIDSATYLWRQQLAFSLFLIGIGFYMVKGKPFGKWLIYLSPLMHLSLMFFVVVFLAFEVYKKYIGLDSAPKFLLIAILNLFAIAIVAPFAFSYLDAIGFSRLESYLEGSAADQINVFVSISLYCAVLLLAHLKFRTDDLNSLFAVVLLATFGVVLAFPSANAVYVRLLIFAFPLYGIYFFRCYLLNFPKRWFLLVIILVFVSGTIRIYRTTLNEEGVVRFLAYGHPFDPIMGVAKMLTTF
jgi:hypothetical protein